MPGGGVTFCLFMPFLCDNQKIFRKIRKKTTKIEEIGENSDNFAGKNRPRAALRPSACRMRHACRTLRSTALSSLFAKQLSLHEVLDYIHVTEAEKHLCGCGYCCSTALDTKVLFFGGINDNDQPLRAAYELLGRRRWVKLPFELPVHIGNGETLFPISYDYCNGKNMFYARRNVTSAVLNSAGMRSSSKAGTVNDTASLQ